MIDSSIILYFYRCTNRDIVQKPSSTLSKDMKTYFFPLICCNCGTWFPSLGDIKFHFNVCKVSHRYFQCGHCALLFNNWQYFVAHVNTKDMVSAKPATDHFSWQNVQKWQNPLQNHHADILHVAMQHSGLHTTNLQPTVDLSFNLPLNSIPLATENAACITATHTSICTQTSPASLASSSNDQQSDEASLTPQTNAISSTYTHVHASLQLNFFIAQLLITRQAVNRPFTAWEHQIIQTTVSHSIWPNSFLSYSTLHELCSAILAWLYEQL